MEVAESWTKLYSVDLRRGLWRLIGFMRNGEVLGVTVRGKLLSYDPISSRMKKLGLRGAADGFHVDSYMESLFLLEAESAALAPESITCGDAKEEGEASDLHRVKDSNYDEQESSAMDCEEFLKELLPEANCDAWEDKW